MKQEAQDNPAFLNEPQTCATGGRLNLPPMRWLLLSWAMLKPLSNSLPVQTFLDNFFKHGQRDKEAESDAHGADSAGIDPAIKRRPGNRSAGAPAEKAPSISGSEHGQGRRRLFGILPLLG
jgi:hypothetical protein